jgi:predicted TIM-barrel fold metal-dependent hydrolase
MGDLTDEQRAKILGGNAARFFGIELHGAARD